MDGKGFWHQTSYDVKKVMAGIFKTSKLEYLKIPFDIRLTLFAPKVLYDIQNAYEGFEGFTKQFLNFLEQHPISSPAELEGAMKQLGLPFTREVIDLAITSLNDFVPESIREK